MSTRAPRAPWSEAVLAAALFAVDPHGTGLRLRGRAGPARDAFLELLQDLFVDAPVRRVPPGTERSRLTGGLDLGATLAAGRPVMQAGLLAEADGGLVFLSMAERIDREIAAIVEAAHDTGSSAEAPARFGIVALDEGVDADEAPPPSLCDRLGIVADLDGITLADLAAEADFEDAAAIRRARARLPAVALPDTAVAALVELGERFGIASLRAVSAALHVARASAALRGAALVDEDDLAIATRLVLLPRAMELPAPPEAPEPPPEPPEARPDQASTEDPQDAPPEPGPFEDDGSHPEQQADRLVEAVRTSLPPDMLARLVDRAKGASRSGGRGAGAGASAPTRGRPAGVRTRRPRAGERLALLATLRAAVPHQPFRRKATSEAGMPAIRVRLEDFRTVRRRIRRRSTTIFVVDASGSAALHRLGEAKGAVELMLAECYVRRDEVALVAFRGHGADLLLPPTRSLARAKRALGVLPGGGGTPLAAGIEEARRVAEQVRKKGHAPRVVMLTDGQANIGKAGAAGRAEAKSDALAAATGFRLDGIAAVLIDTSPRPQQSAREIAAAMDARYMALPQADAARMVRALGNFDGPAEVRA